MANIRQYDNPVPGLQPDERGIDANLQSARRAGAFFNQAGEAVSSVGEQIGRNVASTIKDAGNAAVDYMDHQQISHGSVATSAYVAQKTQEWNQTVNGVKGADGNWIQKPIDPQDPTVAAKFMDGVNSDIETLKSSMQTEKSQQWMESHTEAIRNHFQNTTAADIIGLGAEKAKSNAEQSVNNYSNAAFNDPAGMKNYMALAKDAISAQFDAFNLGAKGEEAKGKYTQEGLTAIVNTGVKGALQKSNDPEATLTRLSSDPALSPYMKPGENAQWAYYARAQKSAALVDYERGRRLDKEATQDRSDSTETGIMSDLYSGDPKRQSQVSARDIANIPDNQLNRQGKERLIGIVNRELKPETDAKISARTSAQIFSEMRKDDADPQKIRQMLFDARTKEPGEQGSLTKSDFNDLTTNLIDTKTKEGAERSSERNEFFKRFAATIDPSMGDTTGQNWDRQFGHHTALGETKMYEAEKALRVREQQLGPDWRKLYDPSSPEYFGKPANLMRYQASMQGAADYQANLSGKNLTGPGKTDTGTEVKDLPPMAGARKGWDGGWYVETAPGKYSRVKP